jgi:hypothetical protein
MLNGREKERDREREKKKKEGAREAQKQFATPSQHI